MKESGSGSGIEEVHDLFDCKLNLIVALRQPGTVVMDARELSWAHNLSSLSETVIRDCPSMAHHSLLWYDARHC